LLTDALLAIAHHLAVFSLAAILFAEWALLRPGLTQRQLVLAGNLDRAYGATAVLAIVFGFARAHAGAKGWRSTRAIRSSGQRSPCSSPSA
jgi:putative membrane protein